MTFFYFMSIGCMGIWVKVFRNGISIICGRQPLKKLKWYDLLMQTISLQIFERLPATNFTQPILKYLDPYWTDSKAKYFGRIWTHSDTEADFKGNQVESYRVIFYGKIVNWESVLKTRTTVKFVIVRINATARFLSCFL